MFTRENLNNKLDERIAYFNSKKQESLLSYTEKCHKKCEEELASFHNEKMNDVQLAMYKANRRSYYESKIEHRKEALDRLYNRGFKFLRRHYEKQYSRQNRIFEIDFLRGILILGMVFDHFIYDFSGFGLMDYLFNYHDIPALSWMNNLSIFASGFWEGDFRLTYRILGLVLFCFLCGISSSLSKNNIKRGLILVGVGLVITLIFNIFNEPILFSTLTMLGIIILAYNILKDIYIFFESRCLHKSFSETKKKSSWKYVALTCAICVFVFWFLFRNAGFSEYNSQGRTLLKPLDRVVGEHYYDDYFGKDTWLNFFAVRHENNFFQNFFHLFNNEGSYCVYDTATPLKELTFKDVFMSFLGAKGYGVDWLGLCPMIGYTFIGGFVGETLYKDKKSLIYLFFDKENRNAKDPLLTKPGKINALLNKIFCVITIPGQHTVLVYIFHQPLIILFFGLIVLLAGGSLII